MALPGRTERPKAVRPADTLSVLDPHAYGGCPIDPSGELPGRGPSNGQVRRGNSLNLPVHGGALHVDTTTPRGGPRGYSGDRTGEDLRILDSQTLMLLNASRFREDPAILIELKQSIDRGGLDGGREFCAANGLTTL